MCGPNLKRILNRNSITIELYVELIIESMTWLIFNILYIVITFERMISRSERYIK